MLYADCNGSFPLTPPVKEYLKNRLDGPFANPNAIHSIGKNIKQAYEKCRDICADILGAQRNQIIFTSGSTEAINQFIQSYKDCSHKKILSSKIEHAAVAQACKSLNFDTDYLEVNQQGQTQIDLKNDHYSLACLMAANNETGVIQDYKKLGEKCQERNIPFFCDTTQIFGKLDFNFSKLPLDGAVLSSHKIGSIQGAGILLIKDRKKINSLIKGGGQEYSLRAGTQNYLAVECMTVALQDIAKKRERFDKVQSLKLDFEKRILESIPNVVIFGQNAERIQNTTLLSIPGIHGQALQIELESRDIFVTTSSACSDNEPDTSVVIKNMGFSDNVGRGVIRLSFLDDVTQSDFDYLYNAIMSASKSLNRIKSF